MPKSKRKRPRPLTQEEIWDDSALINSWNEALEEYQLYHSIAARGEDVQEVLKKADGYESETDEDSESKAYNGNGGSTDNIEEGEIDDESPSQKNKDLSENSTSQMEAHLAEHDQKPHSKHGIRGETESLPQIPEAVVQNVTDEGLRNLMMAWYYAGYYTGLREGQQSAGRSG